MDSTRGQGIGAELVFALRQLRRRPLFATTALLTFALGIGAQAAILSVVSRVLLQRLPYADPARLVAIWPSRTISNAELLGMQHEAKSVSVAAFSPGWGIAMTTPSEARQLDAARVSTNFFATLGVAPRLGRAFDGEASAPGNWNVVVLSHALWQSSFAGDPGIVGKIVDLDGVPHRVLGVMPASFEAFQSGVDAWLPLQIDPASPFFTGQTALAFGRLAPARTAATASAELAALAPALRERFNFPADYARGATVVDLHQSLVGDTSQSLIVLFAAAALLTLIAVANVSNLLIVHAAERRRELAVRRALGATRWQLARQLGVQSMMLAMIGGVIGIAFGAIGTSALKAILPPSIPFLREAGLNPTVMALLTVAMIGAGLVFGIVPALLAAGVDPNTMLRAGASASSDGSRATVRRMFVTLEIALCVVLVVGAALMADSLWRLGRVNLGFNPSGVLSFRVQPTAGDNKSAAHREVFFNELLARVASLPGVSSVGASQHLPLTGFNWHGDLTIEQTIKSTGTPPSVIWRAIEGDYFKTMRIPLIRGRVFTRDDVKGAPRVVVISAAMAAKFWPGRDPIGVRIRIGRSPTAEWETIVGVVGDVRSVSADAPAPDELYRPNAQQGLASMYVVVRSNLSPRVLEPQLRAAVTALDRTVPVADTRVMSAIFDASIATRRTVAFLLGALALVGLALGVVGVYGIVAYSVAQRRRELGVRAALGATPGSIERMFVSESTRLAMIGVAIGVVFALVASRFITTLLFGVRSTEPAVYSAVGALLMLAAATAAWVPARAAARRDPLSALRAE